MWKSQKSWQNLLKFPNLAPRKMVLPHLPILQETQDYGKILLVKII